MDCETLPFVSSEYIACGNVTIPPMTVEDVNEIHIIAPLRPNWYKVHYRGENIYVVHGKMSVATICSFMEQNDIVGSYTTTNAHTVLLLKSRPSVPLAFSQSTAIQNTPPTQNVIPALVVQSAHPPLTTRPIPLVDIMKEYKCSVNAGTETVLCNSTKVKSPMRKEIIEQIMIERTLQQQGTQIDFYGILSGNHVRVKLFTPKSLSEQAIRMAKGRNLDELNRRLQQERFDRAYCVQMYASWNSNMSPRPIAFWKCEKTESGVIVFESAQGWSLSDYIRAYGNDTSILSLFSVLIRRIFILTLTLRWAHTNLLGIDNTGRNIICVNGIAMITDFENAVQCPPDNVVIPLLYSGLKEGSGKIDFISSNFDRNPESYVHFLFVDLLDVCRGFVNMAGNEVVLGKIPTNSPAASIRKAIISNQFTQMKSWVDMYKHIIKQQKNDALPSVIAAHSEFIQRMNGQLPNNHQILPFA